MAKNKPISIKASVVIQKAIEKIEAGLQRYACAAIMDVELEFSYANDGKPVKSQAMEIMLRFKPDNIPDGMKMMAPWWPVGDVKRILTMQNAHAMAKQRGD